jgi:hypothetical protein
MRMVRRLTVSLPSASALSDEVASIIKTCSYGCAPTVQNLSDVEFGKFDAILSVGITGRADLPWTVINSNGWAIRLSSRGRSLPSDCSRQNPVGALGVACLGVAEVFKRLIRLKPERGQLHDLLVFSFYSYWTEDGPGPDLPNSLPVDLLLVGAGAIGNGTIHLLSSLPAQGRVIIVDKQTYGVENWGTCILVGPQDLGVPKAIAAEKWLQGKIGAKGIHEAIESFKGRCGKEYDYPKLIINGLDDRSARRAVQDFWPDQIIDGAIGATSCEVTLHPWGPDLSCLKCDFGDPPTSAEWIQKEATGLGPERLADVFSVIGDDDIRAAPPEKQERLRQRKGQQICSVISEAVLEFLAGRSQGDGFQPYVPFVACLSSCMIVSELVRYVQKMPQVLETGFQFDVMVGPQNGQHMSHARKRDCICVTRSSNIEQLRVRRFDSDVNHNSSTGAGISEPL